jgi:hypothetical protein
MTLDEATKLAQTLADADGRAHVFQNTDTGEHTTSVVRLDEADGTGLYEWKATLYRTEDWERAPRVWHAVLDASTCDECRARHGQRVGTYDHPPLHCAVDDPRGDCRCVAKEKGDG